MRRFVVPLFALAVGFACGWVSRPRPAPPPPIDWAGDVALIRGRHPAVRLRPHSVIADGRPQVVAYKPAGDPEIWVLYLNGNRVQVACTQAP